jgi:hypothetical protein
VVVVVVVGFPLRRALTVVGGGVGTGAAGTVVVETVVVETVAVETVVVVAKSFVSTIRDDHPCPPVVGAVTVEAVLVGAVVLGVAVTLRDC